MANLIKFYKDSLASSLGFTLIELAIVIAVITILASVAYARLLSLSGTSELAVINDFKQQLISAASSFTIEQGSIPNGFNDFVETAQTIQEPRTLTINNLGINAVQTPCQVTQATITCAGTFQNYNNVRFLWNDGDILVTGI